MNTLDRELFRNRRTRRIKDFEELTITDDFMFGAVMSDPVNCKRLLEYILGIKITRLEYVEKQKTVKVDYDAKGVRLDLIVIDENNIVYNIEIQTTSNENLPLRIRYYHDVLDIEMLQRSMDYRELNRCFVIFICTFDMFGKDRYIYTFKRQCQEDQSVFLGDKAVSVVLNTKGSVGEIDPELKDALRYMAGHEPSGKFAKDLDGAVNRIKNDAEWRSGYMTYAMRLFESKLEGIEEGRIEGRRIGEYEDKISAIRNGKGQGSDAFLMRVLGINESLFGQISETIDNYPELSDEEIACKLVNADENE